MLGSLKELNRYGWRMMCYQLSGVVRIYSLYSRYTPWVGTCLVDNRSYPGRFQVQFLYSPPRNEESIKRTQGNRNLSAKFIFDPCKADTANVCSLSRRKLFRLLKLQTLAVCAL